MSDSHNNFGEQEQENTNLPEQSAQTEKDGTPAINQQEDGNDRVQTDAAQIEQTGENGGQSGQHDVFDGAERAAEKYSSDTAKTIGTYTPKHSGERRAAMPRAAKVACISAVCVIALLFGWLSWTVYGYDKVHRGVVVCGIDGAGLTEEQLVQAIAKYGEQLYDKKSIKFSINGQYVCDIEGSSVEAGIDARSSAEEAYAYGRKGGFFARSGQILKGFASKVQIDAKATVNEAQLHAIASQAAEDAANIAAENSYKVENGILYLDTKNLGLKIDPQNVYDMVRERFETADFTELDYSSDIFEPNAAEIERILNSLQSKKKNAALDLKSDPTGGTITPSSEGISFDMDAARKAFEESTDRYVKIKVEYIKPDVTEEQLKEGLFRDELANIATTLNANLKDRTTNVRLAAEFINGKILNSGDEFSYNETVGPRTVARGFQNAKIFQNGDVVNGLGGGICQVSSTLYMAALNSNMKITERSNHNFAVAYTPIGQDATVVYGSKDFKFKNSGNYPIKIIAEQKGSEIRVIIKGTKTDDIKVKMETSVLSKIPFQRVTIKDDSIASGKTVVKNEGFTGYKSKTYRVLLDGSGKEISRTLENTSNYAKLDKVVLVGTKGGSAAVSGSGNVPYTTAPANTTTTTTTAAPVQPSTDGSEGLVIIPPSY